nr:hypothetical protein [uncultured Prevotella sp.]DAJ99713.1 MAG TPA: hypothetical protein [Caudoviricetes sp.]
MNYDKVYIQKMKEGAAVKETVADFDIYCAEIPFRLFVEAKDPSKRDWMDEHGDDEYIPDSGLKLKAYTMDVKFCCKGDKFSSNAKIQKFVEYLTGMDGSGAVMMMYCTWTKIGRRGIRFDKLNDKAELVRDGDGDTLVFTITFKVNDPVSNITPISASGVVTELRKV